jgi:hypothetical protein
MANVFFQATKNALDNITDAFCFVHPLLRASGKDKAMKRTPKTPIEFDYDLWTTEDGKCMVRVKRTSEQCEVSRETFRLLRNEEKKLRRSFQKTSCENEEGYSCTLLSLDIVSDDDVQSQPSWLADPTNIESEVLTKVFIEEFCRTLTPVQAIFFKECILNRQCIRTFLDKYQIGRTTAWRWQNEIREKLKNFF